METSTKSKALEELTAATEQLINPALQSWKEQGGKIAGYFCSYVPDEILTAAGILPFRMRATGNTGTDLADRYLSDCNCSFVRNCFNTALRGQYEFLDGVVWVDSCDHVRRVYDNWKHAIDAPSFLHMLSLPEKTGEKQVSWYRQELEIFKEALETHYGIEITEDQLWEAIKLHNHRRHLQKRIHQLRKNESPPISGTEMLAVIVAGTAMPIEQYNELLRNLLDDLRQRGGISDYQARLMVIGGILDDPEYIRVIEDQGGLVVTDMLCFGTKIMWEDVDEGADDPLTTLARYYVKDRPHCPRLS